jgi:RES domain-containing protein
MPARSQSWSLPVVAIRKKSFWRCLPKQYVRTVLETGPSFTQERRYSVRGEFGAVYFSASKELSLAEVSSRVGEDGEAMACVEFEVTVQRLVDLTRPDTRARLRVQLEDLIRPRISKDAYASPQRIAKRIYKERLDGLFAPSVHDPKRQRQDWFNLILYPANLIRASVREIRADEVAALLKR